MKTVTPKWLKNAIGLNKSALRNPEAKNINDFFNEKSLHTVCVEAKCPNMGRCFSEGDATFLILGNICTRNCRFCAVTKAKPLALDENEPKKIAEAALKWKLKYIVLTSPTRDDLPDGGAEHYAQIIKTVKLALPSAKLEPLVPDFAGNLNSLKIVIKAGCDVLAHNIETVPKLYSVIRSKANYKRSLKILEQSKKLNSKIAVKSGIMLGLGETNKEIEQTLKDIFNSGCDIITLGQYLAPTKNHYPVERYLMQKQFSEWGEKAKSIGFKAVMSGPLVRSSYRASLLYSNFQKNTSYCKTSIYL